MRRAVYAGSFDPITLGHLDVIVRGSQLFDEVVVAVGNNPKKRYFFEKSERENLVRQACEDVEGVRVVSFEGLLVHLCVREGASVILRGLRAVSDFDAEFRNGLANRDISGIETLFLLTDPDLIFVSSSLVKEIASNGGDVSRYVPEVVDEALGRRL